MKIKDIKKRAKLSVAVAVAVIAAAVAVYLALGRSGAAVSPSAAPPSRAVKTSLEWHLPAGKAGGTEVSHESRVRAEVLAEIDGELKEFVRRKGEIKTFRIGPEPLDPDDPDNALRTATMQEVQMIVGIEPGEPIPPVPFNFMVEDAVRESSPGGVADNGNERFLEELAKWKIQVKDSDDEARVEKKRDLIRMQLELLDGIDEGQSVNDTIRAAYEFRKRAYEVRESLMSVMRELQESDPNEAVCRVLVRETNAQLAKEGIKSIELFEIIPDAED